jgi:hypothetical protein
MLTLVVKDGDEGGAFPRPVPPVQMSVESPGIDPKAIRRVVMRLGLEPELIIVESE